LSLRGVQQGSTQSKVAFFAGPIGGPITLFLIGLLLVRLGFAYPPSSLGELLSFLAMVLFFFGFSLASARAAYRRRQAPKDPPLPPAARFRRRIKPVHRP
jgi:hypothetical protein